MTHQGKGAGTWEVRVVITSQLPADWQGAYDSEENVILMADNLTPIQYACVLAHEMSHAKHGDKGCHADKWTERRADIEAARMLIRLDDYKRAEQVCDDEVWIAHELDVMPWVVRAFREWLHDSGL
ncbi:ImmA/IrrE family metallo-endopeptidase [Bifidobacterium sp. 82T10]|uniref:ImmA/IrrE family metallo-endopeptidase n=1 Tax=Bifidobacterium miconis TaxID=2834435 RepID=A0ABS6WHD9_9BIFI|nr:ImmA/IrrE family metallo-endopeptidase [Bifidobacterium miconis]MBW3093440.1 ImmA/IrrE family metallo-endopeptidase [Bifidobacterium miconis]